MANQIPYQTEQEILSRIAQGDLKAYRILFDRHFSDLCNFLLSYLHDRRFAEEIALEIFTTIWEKSDQLNIHTSVKAYLYTAAKNRAISIFRRNKNHLLRSLDIEEQSVIADERSHLYLENKELREIIQAAVDSLPDQSRKIYKMAWEENLSHKEIAEKLGLSPKTVENHVGIALRKLRTQLRPFYKQIFTIWVTAL
ncbi:RNA polymerase sigma-70 factor [Mangrovibacterium sp.]|uniref:RNA polymerase sigma-70 factor n=1 Tax=Mangrovibacterium sp. TaxID=1961364 RepID=UPI003565039C